MFLAGLLLPADAHAVRRFDELTGINQTFTRGYEYRKYSEASHDESSYELLVPDEKKKEAIEAALEEEEKSLETWRYRRSMQATTTYTSNVRRARTDPEGDVIHNLVPTVGMTRRTEHTYVDLFYNASYTNYVESEKLNNLTHKQGTSLGYTFGRLRLNFSNVVSPQAAYDTAERTELENSGRTRVQALSDAFSASASWRATNKTSGSISYLRDYFFLPETRNSLTVNTFSTVTHRIVPEIRHRLTEKTTLVGQYAFERVDYFRGSRFTSDEHAWRAGIGGRINERTYASLLGGYRYRDYKDENLSTQDGIVWTAALGRKLTEKIAMTVTTTKTQGENLDGADDGSLQEESLFAGVDFTFRLTPKSKLSWGGSAGFVSADVPVTQDDPDNPTLTFTRTPETQVYDWYVSWGWQPRRWLTTLLAYQYTNRNGSFKNDEFQEHRTLGSVNATF